MFAEFDSFNNLEVLDMSYNEIDNLVVPQGKQLKYYSIALI